MNSIPQTGRPLFLIPSDLELGYVRSELERFCNQFDCCYALCGVGLVESFAITSQLIQVHRPSQIWLMGIAGTFADRLEIGAAYEFILCSCYGIGVGCGNAYQGSQELGWNIGASIRLNESGLSFDLNSPALPQSNELLTVAAASNSLSEAEQKLSKFPSALAEDMEAYAVARLCMTNSIPLRVIRGISNQVGDRSTAWQIQPAMQAVLNRLIQSLKMR